MSVIFKIAFRNIKCHLHKTLILGGIITIGIFIIIVGNSILDTAKKGIEENYTSNFTGDVILSKSKSRNLSLFSSYNQDSINNENGAIDQYDKIVKYLDLHESVTSYSPQLAGLGTLSMDNMPNIPIQMVSFNNKLYQNTFPDNITIIEGSRIDEELGGILLSSRIAQGINKMSRGQIKIGDNITISATSEYGGTKIRDVKWTGTYKFNNETNQDMIGLSIIDGNNLRAFTGLDQIVPNTVLTWEEKDLIGTIDLDNELFGETQETVDVDPEFIDTSLVDALFKDFDPSESRKQETDIYHFLLIKVDGNEKHFINELKTFLSNEKIDVAVHPWLDGAGANAKTVFTIKNIFNFIILIISLVALIIIMNTLIISLMERISEIGTMRAIGAKKSFIRRIITAETLMITLFFGFIGIIAGSSAILVLREVGLTAPNYYFSILFGAEKINPTLSLGALGISMASLLIVGILSIIYPVMLANRITPIRAIQKGGL